MIRVGIIGAGNIAHKVAPIINEIPKMELYAVASRKLERAKTISAQKYYDCYELLCQDENVDLVYITSPNNFHFEHMLLALKYDKHIICEKPFCLNFSQTKKIIEIAKSKNLFVGEGFWHKYMPVTISLLEKIKSGNYGELELIQANIGYKIDSKERIRKKELGGGALYDIGVYPLTIILELFDYKVDTISTSSINNENGVDLVSSITLYSGERVASFASSAKSKLDNQFTLFTSTHKMVIDNINQPQKLEIFDLDNNKVSSISYPHKLNGFEYQFSSISSAIMNNQLQTPEHDWTDILKTSYFVEQIVNKIQK